MTVSLRARGHAKPFQRKIINRHPMSDEEREAVRADLARLVVHRDQANNAMKGESLSLAQRESCRKAAPIPEEKI